MKYIIVTMAVSTAVFWLIPLILWVCAAFLKKRNPAPRKYEKMDPEGNLCGIFNLIGGFLVFELLSFLIAWSTKSVILNIILHIPALFAALWCAQWLCPYVVNPIVHFFVHPKE